MTTQHYFVEFDDGSSIEVHAHPDTDFDDRFSATCAFTGEKLWVSGWLVTAIVPMETASEAWA